MSIGSFARRTAVAVVGILSLFASGGAWAEVPVKYFEYLESTGTQYVDTDFRAGSTAHVQVRYQQTVLSSTNCVFGEKKGSYYLQFNHGPKAYCAWSNKTPFDSASANVPDDLEIHTVKAYYGNFTVDGNTVKSFSSNMSGTHTNLFLFASSDNGVATQLAPALRIYNVLIATGNIDGYSRCMYPCQMPDGRIGLWDFVGAKFYPNAGTGTFITGPEAAHPAERLDYIRFLSGSYLPTGVKPSDECVTLRFRDEASGLNILGTAGINKPFYLTSSGIAFTFCNSANSPNTKKFAMPGSAGDAWEPRDHVAVLNDHGDFRLDGHLAGTSTATSEQADQLYVGKRYNMANFVGRVYSFSAYEQDGTRVLDVVPARLGERLCFVDNVLGQVKFMFGTAAEAGPIHVGVLDVTVAPEGILGVATQYVGLAKNDAKTLTAPSSWKPGENLQAVCTGWKTYTYDGTADSWVLDETRSGTGTSFNYVHDGRRTKVEWQWTVTDPAAPADAWYVAPWGDDANTGRSWQLARRTIQTAVDDASAGATILVAPGVYYPGTATSTKRPGNDNKTIPVSLRVDKAVTVRGVGGPDLVTVDALGLSNVGSRRIKGLEIVDDGAVVEGLAVRNGAHGGVKTPQTGVYMSAGLMSNCTFTARSTRATTTFEFLGTARLREVTMAPMPFIKSDAESDTIISIAGSADVDRMIVTNQYYGAGSSANFMVISEQAKVRNLLFANNRMGKIEAASWYPLLSVNGSARLDSATVACNEIYAVNGIVSVGAKTAVVTNSIFYGNANTSTGHTDFNGGNNLARVFGSCSVELTEGERGNIESNPLFVDATARDYRLKAISKAKAMGADWLRPTGPAKLDCAFDTTSETISAAGESLKASFSGYMSGDTTGLSVLWDFGDGQTATDWPDVSHLYETAGRFDVTLTVSNATEGVTYKLANAITVIPDTCYVKQGSVGVYPYDTWEKATSTLKEAIDVFPNRVLVTNGTYDIAAPLIMLSRPVRIESVEGPSKTTLNSLGGTSCDHRHFTVSGSDDIVISGFTFIDGFASGYEWTAVIAMSSGVLSNCVVKSTRRVSRSAANYFYGTAKVVDCLFDGHGMGWSNDANTQSGVRVEGNAVLDRCEITAYRIENGSTSVGYDGESPVRIASSGAVVRNCLIHHCTNGVASAERHRGPVALLSGRIENCTIADNMCGGYGGGVWAKGGTIVNSIIFNNTALMGGKDLWSTTATPTIRYSSASDFLNWKAGAGEGCMTKDPIFDATNAYHLTALSTAQLDKGLTSEALGACDLDRQARVFGDEVDMGCYEFAGTTDVPLDGTVAVVGATSGRLPYEAVFELSPVGNTNGLTVVWDFGTGEPRLGGLIVTNTFKTAGSYTVSASFSNEKQEEKTAAIAEPVVAVPQVCYVSPEGSNTSPYDTWETAANAIMTAVALNPKTVLVTNGTYAVSGDGIILSTDLELRSVNGPDVTFIDAQGTCRNVWLTGEGAVCDGFSLIRGTGDWDTKSAFARVQAGTLSHCILTNGAYSYRDSAVLVKDKGSMVDCVVDTHNMDGNADSIHYWGTVVQSGGVIERCTIQRYNYTNQGGDGNSHFAVHVEGTGIFRNCLVRDCVCTQSANPGVYRGAVCVSGDGVVENCTIVNTKSCQQGGAITIRSGAKESPTVRNNVCWNSTLANGSSADDVRDLNAVVPRVSYCRANNLTDGEDGNRTVDPRFSTRKSRPIYSLGSSSPCINAGLYQPWMDGATDITGAPRLHGSRPDMGCYECPSGGFLLIVR